MNLHALRHYHLNVDVLEAPRNSTSAEIPREYEQTELPPQIQLESALTPVLTKSHKRTPKKRFQRVCNGLYRFRRTGTLYAVFKVNGRTRWKSLSTDNVAQAKLLLMEEIKKSTRIDWQQAGRLTIENLVEMHAANPMGLAASTLKIRKQLLNVFKRTWPHGFSMRVSDVKAIMLKSWVAERKRQQALKAAGVNNYVRMLHALFQIAVETNAVIESPAQQLKLLKEETPDRLTPTWEQAHNIISTTKRQISRDMLSAMLLLGLGQAELENLQGEHFDFERGQITVRRQKTQKVFVIPMYPQARDLLERFKAEGRIVVGKPLFDRVRPREALSMACTRLGYPQFSARSLRRAFIIRALEKGIDPRCVASWQGHRDATLVLRVYGHVIQANHNRQMAERLA